MKIVIMLFSLLFNLSLAAENNSNLPLRGQGDYKWIFLQIYEAKLWADKGDDLYAKPFLLELKYSRNFKGTDIVKQSLKELVHAGTPKNVLDQMESKLLEIFPDVNPGDTIQAYYDPTSGVTFVLNSTKDLGKLSDLNLSRKFLDIWFGEKTNAPELKNKLLGNKS